MHKALLRSVLKISVWAMILTAGLCFLAIGRGHAQARASENFNPSYQTKPFLLQELNGALDFGVFLKDENESYQTTSDRDQKQLRFEEKVNLYGKASVYHPNFLEIDFDTTLGPSQTRYSGDISKSENESMNEYDISATLLKEKPLSARLFTAQQEYDVDREFLELLDVQVQTYGGEVRYLAEGYHLNFRMQSIDTEEDSPDYFRKRSEDAAEFRFATLGDSLIDTDFRYTRRMTTDDLSISTDLDYDDLILTNTLEYGNIIGRSFISYYQVSGDFESDTFFIMENVDVTHSDTLQTFYNYNFSQYDTGGGDFTSKINYGELGLRHQLYESLRTRFSAEVSHTDDDNYRELYYQPNLSLAYTKKVPFGRFSAVYDAFWRKTESETKSSGTEANVRRVFSEPHVLRDPPEEWTALDNYNVDNGTVVVWDEGRTTIYDEGSDYELRQNGIVTEIRSLNSFRLPYNSRVLVDYEYRGLPDLDYDTVGQLIDLRYDLTEFVSLFYNHTSVEQKNIKGDTSSFIAGSLTDTKRRSYGAELRWKWFDFFTEWEKDSSDVTPYNAWRVRGDFSISPTRASSLTLTANRSKIRYQDERGTEEFTSTRVSFDTAIARNINAAVNIEFAKDDGFYYDEELWKYSFDLNSRFRLLDFEFKGVYVDRQETYQDREALRLEFRVVRHFSIL